MPIPATLDGPEALRGLEVWFLTGSQELYGDEVLSQVAAQSRAIAGALAESAQIPVRVVWRPVLTGADDIRREMLDATGNDAVIGVIAWMHTFSPAKMWISGLNALGKPLLHLHTQANVDLPWREIDFDFMNLNQSAHGDREFGYIQSRLAIRRKTVAGHVSDPRVIAQVATWSRAAAGWAATRSLKLARFGDNMRNVAVTEGDKTEAESVFGVQVNTWGVNDLAAAVATAPSGEVDALVEEYLQAYDVAAELRPGGERHQSLRDGAAIEAGLRSFLAGGGFGAFTTNFEDLGELRQLPGLAVQRLMADGYGFGAEGDWKTALLVRAAKVMGAGLPGGASLMEDYTYDLRPGAELHPRRPHAGGLPQPDHGPAAAGGPPAGHRRPAGPGAPGLHRRPGPGHRRLADRHAGPLPADRQRRRAGRAAAAAAAAAGGARGVAARPRFPDLRDRVAGGGRGAPHGHVDGGGGGGVR